MGRSLSWERLTVVAGSAFSSISSETTRSAQSFAFTVRRFDTLRESNPELIDLGQGGLPFEAQTVVIGPGRLELVVTLLQLFGEQVALGMG